MVILKMHNLSEYKYVKYTYNILKILVNINVNEKQIKLLGL